MIVLYFQLYKKWCDIIACNGELQLKLGKKKAFKKKNLSLCDSGNKNIISYLTAVLEAQ